MKVERAKAMAIASSEIAAASAGQGFIPCMPSIDIHAARAEALLPIVISSARSHSHHRTQRAEARDTSTGRQPPAREEQ